MRCKERVNHLRQTTRKVVILKMLLIAHGKSVEYFSILRIEKLE